MIKWETITKPVVSAWRVWDWNKGSQKSAHPADVKAPWKSKFPKAFRQPSGSNSIAWVQYAIYKYPIYACCNPHFKRVPTQQGCCQPFSVPPYPQELNFNIRNVMEYLPCIYGYTANCMTSLPYSITTRTFWMATVHAHSEWETM